MTSLDDGWLSSYNTENLTVDHRECHVHSGCMSIVDVMSTVDVMSIVDVMSTVNVLFGEQHVPAYEYKDHITFVHLERKYPIITSPNG